MLTLMRLYTSVTLTQTGPCKEEEEGEKAATRQGTVNSNPSRRERSAETGKAVLEDMNPSDTGHFPPCPSQPLNAAPPSGGGTQVVPLSG